MVFFNNDSNKNFFKQIIKIGLPITIQNLVLSSLNLIDTVIIGGLGEVSIASVGLANQYFFLLDLLLFGTVSGASIFTAQYWGKKDIKNIKRILGLCLITTILISFIFMLLALLNSEYIISLFSKDTNVIRLGGQYLKIICLSYVVTAITFSFSLNLRSIGYVKTPMIISIIALLINTLLNYILVYGINGYFKFGVKGSAIATLIARCLEMILMISVVYIKRYPLASTLRELLDLSSYFVKRFFRVSIPVILNESIWALGITVYAAVYAHMGTKVIASTNIVGLIEKIAMVIFYGLGNSAAVMIGNKIGEKDEKSAYDYAIKFIILSPVLGLIMGFILYFAAPHLLVAFNVSRTVHIYVVKLLHIMSFFLWIKIFNYTNVVGILRSGGDTKFCLFLDVGGMWLIGVPLVCFAGLYLHLPIYTVYIFVYLEEVVKFIIGLPRITSKKWINNLVSH
ncbi:MATE family efflux transporter [Clostridium oryzae]|uniref:Multidrug resistance protein NorM n=1 Tax=Clostridium oryzae TaxID=1450648 RepID=A0A1V4IGT3_9CLOT|nr:MATE family efflux transporter [Clostridium oryzae]OPJ59192.1 multidrug resistance protein NorM [Clostridium oryzae]